MNSESKDQESIIFFDGACGMCNVFVKVVLRADRRQTFLFATLQGKTAQTMLPPLAEDAQERSVTYVDEAGVHDQSDALIEVCRRLGGLWLLPSMLRFVPRALRNLVYRAIAQNRHRLFGNKHVCTMPTKAEMARFLP
jgi:predicted DCC family thiol-disulfide oxidoreductase YuxK